MYSRREMRLALATIIAVFAIMVAGAFAAEHHYYVATTGTDDDAGGRGESFGNPWQTITYALGQVSGTDNDPAFIHIAAGTYKDTDTNNETFPLDMEDWVSLLGEDQATTTLHAEDAAYHVIECNNVNHLTIENLTITGGNAHGSDPNYLGGGIYCHNTSSPTITNCTISGNTARAGGGIMCNCHCCPTLTNCTISGNTALCGAGIYCIDNSSPTLTGCTISGNTGGTTECGGGGLMFCSNSSPTLTNCVIYKNIGCDGAGCLCSNRSSPHLTNCTIADNRASSSGGGIYLHNVDCFPVLLNCILWGDTPDEISRESSGSGTVTVSYSDVDQDGYEGSNYNIRKDPGFVPLDGDDNHTGYYLMHDGPQAKDSKCLDAGTGAVGDYDGMTGTTTSTDGSADGDDDSDPDTGPIDMGYHYEGEYTGSGNTYIELVSFTARPVGPSIVLDWETGVEIDNAGFLIYRAVAGTFDYQQVSDLIAAEGSPSLGASYSFIDREVERGVLYNYWLIDIETSGKWTAHGPVSARLPMGLRSIELPSAFAQGYGGQVRKSSIGGR